MGTGLWRTTVAIVAVSLLAACSQAQPAPAEAPNVWALVLEVDGSAARLVSATPARGVVPSETLAENARAVLARDTVWLEYGLRTSANTPLATGGFGVSLRAIVEPGPDEGAGGPVRVRRRIVTVAVPYDATAANITLRRVLPSDAIPADKWERTPIQSFPLPGAPPK